jgi:hypothetical protein
MIETTLERIATALERIADLQAGRNLILEAGSAAAEVAEVAVEKAASRGRRKKNDEPAEPKVETPAPAANAPTVASLQARAAQLSPKFGKEKIVGLIKEFNPAGANLSSMSDEARAGMWGALDALEVGATADPEFA